MKCSLSVSNFLEKISSHSHSIVILYFFALIAEEGFLISPFYNNIYFISLIRKLNELIFKGIEKKSIQHIVLLLLLLSHFSHVRLCATPYTAAHQAPLSLGFSRQEHWNGLPFPSPMHESGK